MNADKLIRVTTAAVVVGIGAVAAIISYKHALDVAVGHGETGRTARMLPLTIDGLVLVASLTMLDSARRGQSSPALAKIALALGIGATIAVNVLHGIAHGPIGAVISSWPAVTLVVVVELLMGMIRRGRGTGPLITPVETPALVDGEMVAIARDTFQDVIASGGTPSLRSIREQLRVGHPRAKAIQRALVTEAQS